MRVVECRVSGKLTAEELQLLNEIIIGQAADGGWRRLRTEVKLRLEYLNAG
ncbi:hypothetical protein [Lacrimispora algidixylanolytica]|uniref:hypothetical protein n=1 Tax=Lacrimispora algidixylanolytica TaxID=94868 RepID=UPI0013149616|nr:hypothetical protein [Lacrimispora algidixylanolytica]